jgi:DNA replication protein DnaC
MSKIEETLRKIAADTLRENSPNLSSTEPHPSQGSTASLGDPNCPICGGSGYYRLDVPVGHVEFGRLQVCTCRQGQVSQRVRQNLYTLSNLEELHQLTFENFKPRGNIGLPPMQADSLERAFNQARHFSQTLKGWLLIQG